MGMMQMMQKMMMERMDMDVQNIIKIPALLLYLVGRRIDPNNIQQLNQAYRRGFSMEELTKMMQRSISTRVVVILDCCHSGSAKISKGNAEEAANKALEAIDEKSKKLQGQRKCILAACQAAQFAYTTGEHSLFTQYLLQGLNGDTESIDNDGNVTPESLGNYVERKIMKLPDNNRRQRPITRAEGSGNIILASYPKLKPLKIEDTLASMLTLLREGNVQEFNKMREANSAIIPEPGFCPIPLFLKLSISNLEYESSSAFMHVLSYFR